MIIGCVTYYVPPKLPKVKLNYIGTQLFITEKYLIDSDFNPPIMIGRLHDNSINEKLKPYYDTIIENSRPQSLLFKKDLVTVEEYSNGNIIGVEDLYYSGEPYDLKIYKTDPNEPIYRGGVQFNDTVNLILNMLFTLKDNNKPFSMNIKNAVYCYEHDCVYDFINYGIDAFKLSKGDTIYLQTVYLNYIPK